MSAFYLDSSGLVKRYARERGSAWVRTLTDAAVGHTIIIAEITMVETAAAIASKQRAPGGITRQDRDVLHAAAHAGLAVDNPEDHP